MQEMRLHAERKERKRAKLKVRRSDLCIAVGSVAEGANHANAELD
jgi:hypothetical protein